VARNAERFDRQARHFDDRAGIPSEAGAAAAQAVVDIAALSHDDLVLEIGAGTGAIGRHLVPRVRYVGLDSSAAMLEVFREEQASLSGEQLIRGDADEAWPVRDHCASAIVASRVAHLLDAEHVMTEFQRVGRRGSCFLIGRVKRDPDGIKSRLRQRRQALFCEAGFEPRSGEQVTDRLLDGLVARGHTRLAPRVVATWMIATSPEAVLESWASLTAVGGQEVAASTRDAVLQELRTWVEMQLDDLTQPRESTEHYTIAGVRHAA
jgi:ubiquinone/menaquinone biosynthesis C-methylase UbiE